MFRGTFALKKGWIFQPQGWIFLGTITPRHQTDMIRRSAVVGWTNRPHQTKVKMTLKWHITLSKTNRAALKLRNFPHLRNPHRLSIPPNSFWPYSKADHSVIWWTSTPGWKPGGLKLNVRQGWDIPSLKHQKLPNIFPPFKRKEEFFFLSLGERLLKSQFPPMALWLEASQTRKSGIIIFHVILHPKHPLDIFRSFVNIRPVRLNMCCKSHEPQVPWRDATMKRGHIETGYHHQPHLQGPVLRIGCSCWLAVFAVHTYSKDAFSCRHDGTKKTEERVTK